MHKLSASCMMEMCGALFCVTLPMSCWSCGAACGRPGRQVQDPGPGACGGHLPGCGLREDAALHGGSDRSAGPWQGGKLRVQVDVTKALK